MAKGLPEVDSLETYGGALQNYAAVEDPTTDEDAASRNLYAMNVAAMTQTAWRAIRSFVGHATTPTDPVSGFVHGANWGDTNDLKPTVAKGGTGIYDLAWPATVDDELEQEHTLNFKRALAQVESSDGTFRAAHAKVTGPNTVRVYTYSGTTLNDLAGETVTVWVR